MFTQLLEKTALHELFSRKFTVLDPSTLAGFAQRKDTSIGGTLAFVKSKGIKLATKADLKDIEKAGTQKYPDLVAGKYYLSGVTEHWGSRTQVQCILRDDDNFFLHERWVDMDWNVRGDRNRFLVRG